MKYSQSILIILSGTLISFLVFISSCDGDSEVSENERRTKYLTSGTWELESITINGVPELNLFKGMTLSFSSTICTATNGGKIFGNSSSNGSLSWYFDTSILDNISFRTANGAVFNILVEELTDSVFSFSLYWDTTSLSGGRQVSLQGEHVFVFKK